MSRTTVFVTGIGGAGHGEQIFKALRLAETDYEIVGADVSPENRNLFEVDHAYLLPRADDPQYMEALLKVCQEHSVRAIFHGNEAELKVMSRHRDSIEDAGVFLPINPAPVIDVCMDKNRTLDFLSKSGFPVAEYRAVRSVGDLAGYDAYPAVLKPSVGGGGSADVFVAQNRDELTFYAEHLLRTHEAFVLQEYVGTPDTEYTVGVLIDMDGQLLNSIAVKRDIMNSLSNRTRIPNRTGREELGDVIAVSSGISQGVVGRFPEVTEPCERIATALGCRGAVNIQCRLVEGAVYVFEINPRFSGTTSLRAMVGYNEPDTLIRRHLFGEVIECHFPYREATVRRSLQEFEIPTAEIRRAQDL